MLHVRLASTAVAAALVTLTACGDDSTTTTSSDDGASQSVIDPGDGGDYAPTIDPADFSATVDHPYLPMTPGSRWVYEGETEDGLERIEVVVTDEVREVMGVTAVVVRDTETLDGEVIEDTFDWFAQDRDGNVWYFGEDTTEFEDGEAVSTAGSWEAGVDGALPGIVMLADPAVGDAYRQEFYAGEAEDMGEVLRLGESVTVPAGAFDDVVVTEDWTPLEPEVVEEKSYAPGVGLVLEEKVSGGDGERVELVEFVPGS
jgi:hypothetical protein